MLPEIGKIKKSKEWLPLHYDDLWWERMGEDAALEKEIQDYIKNTAVQLGISEREALDILIFEIRTRRQK